MDTELLIVRAGTSGALAARYLSALNIWKLGSNNICTRCCPSVEPDRAKQES